MYDISPVSKDDGLPEATSNATEPERTTKPRKPKKPAVRRKSKPRTDEPSTGEQVLDQSNKLGFWAIPLPKNDNTK